ncbi:MAG: hypothetical protein DWQ01_14820 [Planctomycetota bacterium]|nr:MAG: hypothetical protein DWQ01_14820 [Planctomycetota bacterium]
MKFLLKPISLGNLFGIPIRVVPAVPLLALLFVASAMDRGGGAGATFVFWSLVLLAVSLLCHEMGHALVARMLGLRVLHITIWPIGGLAHLEGMHERPYTEAPVSLAGPGANLILAALAPLLPQPWDAQALWINLILGLGNLLPAFPMDGGRILRAFLARNSPEVDATHAAVKTAGWVSFVLLIFAWQYGFLLLALMLAVYLWISGRLELSQLVLRSYRMPSMSVGEVYRRSLQRKKPDGAANSQSYSPFSGGGFSQDAPTAGSPPPPQRPSGDPDWTGEDVDPEVPRELENFHGSLDEFFRRHQKGKNSHS